MWQLKPSHLLLFHQFFRDFKSTNFTINYLKADMFTTVEINFSFYTIPSNRRTRSRCNFGCLWYCVYSRDYKIIFRSYNASKYRASSWAGRNYCTQFQSLLFCTMWNISHQHCINPYPTAFPYGNGMVLHFYQQQESSTTKTVHKVINKRLKTYV